MLTGKNLTVKRVGNGVCSSLWDEVIGKNAKKNYSEDDLIELWKISVLLLDQELSMV